MEKLANKEARMPAKTPTVAASALEKRSEKRVFPSPSKGSGRLTSLQKMKTPILQSKDNMMGLSYNYNEPGMMDFSRRVPNNLIG